MEKELTVIEAFDLIHSGQKLQLLDVRSAAEYQKGHLEGFENIPLAELSHYLPKLDAKRKILLIDQDGKQSHQAQTLLEACGFAPLVIRGGIQDWNQIIA